MPSARAFPPALARAGLGAPGGWRAGGARGASQQVRRSGPSARPPRADAQVFASTLLRARPGSFPSGGPARTRVISGVRQARNWAKRYRCPHPCRLVHKCHLMGSGRARVYLRESTWRALADRLGTFLFTVDLKGRSNFPPPNSPHPASSLCLCPLLAGIASPAREHFWSSCQILRDVASSHSPKLLRHCSRTNRVGFKWIPSHPPGPCPCPCDLATEEHLDTWRGTLILSWCSALRKMVLAPPPDFFSPHSAFRHLRPKKNKVLKDLEEELTSPRTSAGFRYLNRRAKKTSCLSTLILPPPS